MEEVKHINKEEIEILLKAAEELGSKFLSWLKEIVEPGDPKGQFYVMIFFNRREISIHYELKYKYDYERWADFHYIHNINKINFDSKEAIAKKTEEIKSEEYFRKAKYDALKFLLKNLIQACL